MLRIISFIFLMLVISGCNQEPSDNSEETPILQNPIADKAPTTLKYKVLNASYFKDINITPNIATVDGEAESMEFSIEPTLPSGLFFDPSTGAISGTPINLMDQTFYSIKAKNLYGLVSLNLSIKVVIPPPENLSYPWTSAGQDIYNFTNIVKQQSSVSGLTTGYCIAPSLQPGLNFDQATGDISGSPQITEPTSLGRYFSYTVRAFNSTCPNTNNNCSNNCGSNSYSFKLRYLELPPVNLNYNISSPTYSVGVPIPNNCPTYEGGFVTLFVVDPVSLPAGLNFNLINGCIQGTPLSEVSTPIPFTVTAINTGGSTSASISLRVFSAPPTAVAYTQTNLDYTKGQAVANPLSFTGGKPTSFLVDKPLPPGLQLNSFTGAIEGIPTILVPRDSYAITASNTGGSIQTVISIGVKDVAPANLNYGHPLFKIRNQEFFNTSIRGNTGGEVVSFSINPPLPPGLTFSNSTGAISGIPTQVLSANSYTVLSTNTGGSFSFQFSLEILPEPNYDFTYKLVSKEFSPPTSVSYVFEIENRSREYDNSVGINLSMPFSFTKISSKISSSSIDSNCFNVSVFTYLQKCKIKFSLVEENLESEDLNISLSASDVLSKNINLSNFLDISPKNVVLTGDRGRVVKAVYNPNEIVVDITNPAELEQIGETIIPLVSQEISTTGSIKDFNNTVNLQRDLLVPFTNLVETNLDPDLDNTPGFNLFSNLEFTTNLLVTANMSGYSSTCVVNPPYSVSGGCILGSFSVGGADLNFTGEISVNIGSVEGLEQEQTRSNSIKVDVYNFRRIFTYYNSMPQDPKSFKKSLVVHNNKIYSSGVTDPGAANLSLTNKLLSFDPVNSTVTQISNFSNPGDDFPNPLISFEGLLFFEARTPSTLDASVPFLIYAYDDSQHKINPLFTKTFNNQPGGRIVLAKPANSSDETWSMIHNNQLFFNSKINDSEGTDFYNVVVSYSKLNNILKKEISKPAGDNVADSNGVVDKSSFIYSSSDNKFYFNSFVRVPSPVKNTTTNITYNGGFKFQSLDPVLNKQNKLSRKNNDLVSDYLDQLTPYDGKYFFISKTPTGSSSGATTNFNVDSNLLESELVYYDSATNQLKSVFESGDEVKGVGNILGVHYGKLFFSMPTPGNKNAIFVYDALTQEVSMLYETATGERINKISRYSNYTNASGFYFTQAPTNSSSKNLMQIKQQGNSFLVTMIAGRSSVYVDENTTMFTYNNTLFFSCEEGGEFKLNSLCSYNENEKTFSLILRNVAPVSNPSILPGQRPQALILLNNRVYFTGYSYNPSSRQAKYGLFEMCILTETGCSP